MMFRSFKVCLFTTALFVGAVCSSASAKEIIPTSPDTPVLGELEPVLVRAMLTEQENNDASLADVNKIPALKALVEKHNLQLFGGPMVGCQTATGAKIWLRTFDAAEVTLVVGVGEDLRGAKRLEPVRTEAKGDYTAILPIENLKSNTRYYYQVFIDGKPTLPKPMSFSTAPAKSEPAIVKVAFGGGARLVPEKEHIWATIAKRDPLAFLFLGDNLYMDMPEKRNLQRLYYYRRQLQPAYRTLTSQTGCYAIWDDHDFGANDCQGGPEIFTPAWKPKVWNVFRENWVNPYYGGGAEQPGCWFDFSLGDIDFFMTDGRYYRDYKTKGEERTMLGPVQKKWLLEKLKNSKAKFKVIASGTLWTEHADKGGADSWWGVKHERNEIFDLIVKEKIDGVILLSADRHRTDVYKIEYPGSYPLYEFETSKLTNNHTHGVKKEAVFSYNKGNFYGMLTFDTTKTDPELTFQCITIDDEEVYSLTLKRSELEIKP